MFGEMVRELATRSIRFGNSLNVTQGNAGPFETYGEMMAWFNQKLALCKRDAGVSASSPQFDDTYPLVFTHFDLKPGNIILGDDNKVWLIDFGNAGFYPVPFEYAGMYPFWDSARITTSDSRNWAYPTPIARILVGTVAGFFQRWYANFYDTLHYALWDVRGMYAVETPERTT